MKKLIGLLVVILCCAGVYKIVQMPEPLTGDLAGYWSRRIDEKNRLVYKIVDGTIRIAQCRTHYGDK